MTVLHRNPHHTRRPGAGGEKRGRCLCMARECTASVAAEACNLTCGPRGYRAAVKSQQERADDSARFLSYTLTISENLRATHNHLNLEPADVCRLALGNVESTRTGPQRDAGQQKLSMSLKSASVLRDLEQRSQRPSRAVSHRRACRPDAAAPRESGRQVKQTDDAIAAHLTLYRANPANSRFA